MVREPHCLGLRLVWILSLAALPAGARAARADGLPHERQGWMVGGSLGGGYGRLTNEVRGNTESAEGLVAELRAGKMVAPRLLVHLELASWVHEGWVGTEKFELTMLNYAAALTFFPGNPATWSGGAWVRAGLGFTNVRVVSLESVVSPQGTATGWGWLAAVGYEWRFSTRFAMGLGVGVDDVRPDSDVVSDGVFVPLTVDFNWYF